MNGAHDMGGMHGFGPINAEPERDEPVFHADWESRVLALTLACGMLGRWNIDISRHARERQDPAQYLANSYYETWTEGLETLLLESGLVSREELDSGHAASLAKPIAVDENRARAILASGGPTLMDSPIEPRFAVGDRVRVVNDHPRGHTRAPRYVRGRVGTVELYHGVHVFADASALGERRGEPLYAVRFEARELWGRDGGEGDTVLADLWQPYLEAP